MIICCIVWNGKRVKDGDVKEGKKGTMFRSRMVNLKCVAVVGVNKDWT